MSVGGNDSRFAKSTGVNGNITSTLEDYWIRPSDWLAMTTVSATEQKFVGLFAVFDQPNNYIAVSAQGAYTVDWGDGSSPANFASGTVASNNYSYSSISSSTTTSRGYRQVLVTITMQAGQNFTTLDLTQPHPSNINNPGYNAPWLDIVVSGPNLVNVYTANAGTNGSRFLTVERIQVLSSSISTMNSQFTNNYALNVAYIKTSNTINDTRSMFNACYNLKAAVLDFTVGATCNGSNMFLSCRSLRRSPAINFGASGQFTLLTAHFQGCLSLEEVYPYPTANCTSFASMFSSCVRLASAPAMNTSSATDVSNMFLGCQNLKYVPMYDLNGVTNMASMFNNCYSLESIPEFDFSTITDMNSAFNNCNRLKTLPTSLNSANAVTALNVTFNGCGSLTRLPTFNTSAVTNFTNAFSGCESVTQIPAYNANSATTIGTFMVTGRSVTKIDMTNVKVTLTLPSGQIQKTQMEDFFTNGLNRVTTTQTITLGTNPATVSYTKSTTFTSGSATVTVNNNTSLTTGMYVTSANLGATKAVTFQDTGDTVTLNNHGFAAGKAVAFSVITTTTGITTYTTYYVVNPTTNTFQLEATPGGGVLPLTTDGSGTILIAYKVNNIAGTTVTLDAPATATGTVNAVFRDLNTSIPVFKGWTVSG